jgi:hypothetical protein
MHGVFFRLFGVAKANTPPAAAEALDAGGRALPITFINITNKALQTHPWKPLTPM